MAYPVASLDDDVTAIVAATWPEVVANGIFRLDDAARVSWEEKTFPFAVWERSEWEPTELGLTNTSWELLFEVHYLAEVPALVASGLATVEAKLMALRDAMFAGAFTASSATLWDVARFNTDGDYEANAIFLSKNVPFVGGMISFRFSVGETAV